MKKITNLRNFIRRLGINNLILKRIVDFIYFEYHIYTVFIIELFCFFKYYLLLRTYVYMECLIPDVLIY